MAAYGALSDPDFAKQVAEYFVSGATRDQMCKAFDVKDPYTITRWRRDPRVRAHTHKLIEDRILQITRKTDSVIEARLENAENLTLKELLDIRKEFLGGKLREQSEKADHEVTGEAIDALEKNPELMEDLRALLDAAES